MSLVVRDAFWQIAGRVVSALMGFLVVKLITPYLWPLRYGDYSTILKYFAIWSALADFWIYVLALNSIWKLDNINEKLKLYHKFLWFRFFMVIVIYLLAFCIAFFIPAYVHNPFIINWLVLGMIFSATFMLAGIVQLPLQLNWKMKTVSQALILARVVQVSSLLLIIFVFFPHVNFNNPSFSSITAFLLVLSTVFLSWLTQYIYVHRKWSKHMKFKIDFDFWFIKENLKKNWRYGVSYYLSSFHTLIVLIFLSVIFPTAKWFDYVWIWALALALAEILLIVPSALWNSIIHKISSYKKDEKQKSLWYFLTFIIWFGLLMLFNFIIFKSNIISLIAWNHYLSTTSKIWSDYILPFLAFVLFLSFIKQTFNYILVSFDKQNKLFSINVFWVIIWVILWLILIPKYNINGWIITQIVLEFCFVSWILFVARKNGILPKVEWKYVFYSFIIFMFFMIWWYFIDTPNSKILFVIYAFFVNMLYIWVSYKLIMTVMKNI